MARKQKPTRTRGRGPSKAVSKTQRELQRIENLLGEDFTSLAEARRALKAETGPKKGKVSYTVGELSTRKHKTVRTLVTDLEGHSEEVDALKKDADYWGAEIYGAKTYSLYPSIEGLAKKIGSYRGLQEEHPRAALKNIKIIKVSGQNALNKYLAARRKQTEDSWRRTREKHKVDRKRTRKQASAIKKLQAQIKALKTKIKGK